MRLRRLATGSCVTSIAVVLMVCGSAGAATPSAACINSRPTWKGAVYRLSGGQLSLTASGQYRDATGTQQEATFTMIDRLTHGVPLTSASYALFNQGTSPLSPCHFHPGLLVETAPKAVFNVNASWTDSATDTGNESATTGGCTGRYEAPVDLEAGWNIPLTAIETNKTINTRVPKMHIESYVNPVQFGSCNQDDVEILRDAIAGGLDTSAWATFHLAVPTLNRLGRHFSIGVDISHYGPVPVQGSEFYQEPGATAAVQLRWRGTLNFSRVFTCQPHGCIWPPPG